MSFQKIFCRARLKNRQIAQRRPAVPTTFDLSLEVFGKF